MRNLIANTLMVLSAACMTGSALHAETYHGNATIPFAFELHGKTMPAGNYAIQQSTNEVPLLRNIDTKDSMYVQHAGPNEGKGPARLVFHRYGDRYFLAEIWSPGKVGTVIKPGRVEKELMLSGERAETAVIALKSVQKAD